MAAETSQALHAPSPLPAAFSSMQEQSNASSLHPTERKATRNCRNESVNALIGRLVQSRIACLGVQNAPAPAVQRARKDALTSGRRVVAARAARSSEAPERETLRQRLLQLIQQQELYRASPEPLRSLFSSEGSKALRLSSRLRLRQCQRGAPACSARLPFGGFTGGGPSGGGLSSCSSFFSASLPAIEVEEAATPAANNQLFGAWLPRTGPPGALIGAPPTGPFGVKTEAVLRGAGESLCASFRATTLCSREATAGGADEIGGPRLTCKEPFQTASEHPWRGPPLGPPPGDRLRKDPAPAAAKEAPEEGPRQLQRFAALALSGKEGGDDFRHASFEALSQGQRTSGPPGAPAARVQGAPPGLLARVPEEAVLRFASGVQKPCSAHPTMHAADASPLPFAKGGSMPAGQLAMASRGARAQESRRTRGPPNGAPRQREGDSGGPGRRAPSVQVLWPVKGPPGAPQEGPQTPLPPESRLPFWVHCCYLALLGAPSPLFRLVSACSCRASSDEAQQHVQQLLSPEVRVELQAVTLASACCRDSKSVFACNTSSSCPGRLRPFFAAADLACCYEALLPAGAAAAAAEAADADCSITGPWREALAQIAEAVEAELQHFEFCLSAEVISSMRAWSSPLLLAAAVDRWRPSLLLLTRLCKLDFSSACLDSSSKEGWQFPRGTALLARLLRTTAALQHTMLPPPSQQQRQQQLPHECALAVRLFAGSAPPFLRFFTRCCYKVGLHTCVGASVLVSRRAAPALRLGGPKSLDSCQAFLAIRRIPAVDMPDSAADACVFTLCACAVEVLRAVSMTSLWSSPSPLSDSLNAQHDGEEVIAFNSHGGEGGEGPSLEVLSSGDFTDCSSSSNSTARLLFDPSRMAAVLQQQDRLFLQAIGPEASVRGPLLHGQEGFERSPKQQAILPLEQQPPAKRLPRYVTRERETSAENPEGSPEGGRSVKPPEGYSEGALCIKFGSRAPAEWLGASLGALLQRPLLLQEALATRALLMLVLGDGSLERLLHQIKQAS
ncbi:hypothetical protein cyc_04206 [Cyclospora cayetanensis]|uniref:Uncharacterized protein n=1 Tax=Cyclospora cayetanensis TaxID=88456 RepID=A0A1D3CY69_9EIME|nr:hypothetical protein cyc_04206 [Cyclospora cayetanensis]